MIHKHIFIIGILLLGSTLVCPEAKSQIHPAYSYGTKPETDPPRYVTQDFYPDIDLGMELRTRFERRENDFRRADYPTTDDPILYRLRGYLGVREFVDHFSAAFEFTHADKENNRYPRDDRDVNRAEFIQAFLEYNSHTDTNLRMRYGRMAFELLDRRLIARNEWRNTANTFQGIRATLGKEKEDPYTLDLLALQPIRRRETEIDLVYGEQKLFALVGAWSGAVTIQPYFFLLDDSTEALPREVYSPGVRSYGLIPYTDLDYDLSATRQFGHYNYDAHNAKAFTAEIGKRFDTPVIKRISLFYGEASGDRYPDDASNERFESFYGFARVWSPSDYFAYENVSAIKPRIEGAIGSTIQMDGGYSSYWLASSKDRWRNSGLVDITGASGDHIGEELDLRAIVTISNSVKVTIGHAIFMPRIFAKSLGRDKDSHFTYIECNLKIL